MVGPIRSLDDLARKGFDLNVKCPCGKYERTIPIAEARALFRARGRSEAWARAGEGWKCAWCGRRDLTVKLAAYPAAPPAALEIIRAAAVPGRRPQPSRQQVQDALLALPSNTPLEAIQAFWRAYTDDPEIPASRTSGLQASLSRILRALGRYHDDEAPRLIRWKFGEPPAD